MNDKHKGYLLERIASVIGTEMLSDLRAPHLAEDVLLAVHQQETESFPLTEWKRAADYMTGISREYASCCEAKQELVKYFQKTINGKY